MIPLKHPAAYWTANNPILELSQQGFETDTGVLKQGDGITAWNDLAFVEPIYAFSTTTGTDDYVTDLLFPKILGLYLGLRLRLQIENDNAGDVTLDFNDFGPESVLNASLAQLDAAALKALGIYDFFWNGTNWQLSEGGAGATPTLSQVLTAGDDATELDIKNLGALAYNENTKAQIVANTNNYAIGAQTNFRLSTDATRNITGMTGGYEGKTIIVQNIGANRIRFTNQDALSTAANRIITGTGVTYQLNADETISFIYDSVVSRWRLRIS